MGRNELSGRFKSITIGNLTQSQITEALEEAYASPENSSKLNQVLTVSDFKKAQSTLNGSPIPGQGSIETGSPVSGTEAAQAVDIIPSAGEVWMVQTMAVKRGGGSGSATIQAFLTDGTTDLPISDALALSDDNMTVLKFIAPMTHAMTDESSYIKFKGTAGFSTGEVVTPYLAIQKVVK